MTPTGIFAGIGLLVAVYCAVDPFNHAAMSEFPGFETVKIEMPAWSDIPVERDPENLLQKSEIKFLNQVQGPESMAFDPTGSGPYTGIADGRIVFWDGEKWTDFAYTSANRLRKYWLKGEKAGISEVMAVLPGFPDNVRTNEKGEFWVAIHCRRTIYSYLLALYPKVRKFWLKLPISAKLHYLMQIGGRLHAAVVKYSPEGKLLQILEDRQGKVVKAVSEVEEKDGKLWMGSVLMPFVAVYQLD
ncbi:Strictosidine synthase [Handroanthus impetiginosus]|uniref:Strictosidine synthase n=1 Tax=Handroanthus impetiginosus TaxID=429701 RepID=A0A2G9G696_9LAMI|nr:Strictosidine synthase [Handroanthus impetiginosus]